MKECNYIKIKISLNIKDESEFKIHINNIILFVF